MRFFKYVTADTARTILENSTLRFSSPAMFNDPFDTQFDLHLEFDEATIIDLVLDEFWKIFSGQKILEPANSLGHVLELFLARERGLTPDEIFRRHEHEIRDAVTKSIAEAKTRITAFHGQQRLLLRNARLLCLSEVHDNILMWPHYAKHHSGAVLEFDSDKRKDSPFKTAERVIYSKTMPRLVNEKEMVQFLSGQRRMDPNEIMHNEIFVKADDWSYEKEWRIWLPGRDADRNFIDIQFDREDLVGIYFGCRMSEQHRTALLDTLIEHFPNASACQTPSPIIKIGCGCGSFCRIDRHFWPGKAWKSKSEPPGRAGPRARGGRRHVGAGARCTATVGPRAKVLRVRKLQPLRADQGAA